MSTTEMAPDTDNPYLQGVMAPVRTEVTAVDLEVSGQIPEHLHGRYLRNGPNPAAGVDPATYHWFSGDGWCTACALRDGRARGTATAGCVPRRSRGARRARTGPIIRAPACLTSVPTPT